MPLDGISISAVVSELNKTIIGGRVDKAAQPERDEIILPIRAGGENRRLLLSANPSQPRVCLTKDARPSPLQAPMFAMTLRKHLAGGRVVSVAQPGFERIVRIHIQAANELGDYVERVLTAELMGKHSNIILTDEKGLILDSVKHVPAQMSSVRQVLPGREYAYPPGGGKLNPLELPDGAFIAVFDAPGDVPGLIYKSLTGISPAAANEICFRAGIDLGARAETLADADKRGLLAVFNDIMRGVREEGYTCAVIISPHGRLIDFSAIDLTHISGERRPFESPSEMIEFFYAERDALYRRNQKTADLRRVVQTNIERCVKKCELYERGLRDAAERDSLKLWGELITANIYAIKRGMTRFSARNFYDEAGGDVDIRLDPQLSPAENAQRYFNRYNKEKRAFAALREQLRQNDEELRYLEEVSNAVGNCVTEADAAEIRDELAEQGFIKRQDRGAGKGGGRGRKKAAPVSAPMKFISSDGCEIYVGKNNRQNDELTLRFASAGDIWMHAKNIPGSHVIIRANGQTPPDKTLTEAAHLAAYFSKARHSAQVPVDYTRRKYVKKPSGAKPGLVIYTDNSTAYVTPDEGVIRRMAERS